MTNSVAANSQYLGIGPVTVSTSRDFTNLDDGELLQCPNGVTLTIPSGLNSGWGCAVAQTGSDQVTIGAGSGVTVSNVDSASKTSGINAVIAIVQIGKDSYLITGSTGS